jgi:hypothetical protein
MSAYVSICQPTTHSEDLRGNFFHLQSKRYAFLKRDRPRISKSKTHFRLRGKKEKKRFGTLKTYSVPLKTQLRFFSCMQCAVDYFSVHYAQFFCKVYETKKENHIQKGGGGEHRRERTRGGSGDDAEAEV